MRYLKNAKHLYLREYFSDEDWDMIFESLKLLSDKKEYWDTKFQSVHRFDSENKKQEFANGALEKIYEMFYITDGCEFDE